LRNSPTLLLTDVVAAETIFVLESFYEAPRSEVANAVHSLLSFEAVLCIDTALLLRAVEVYETDSIDFVEHASWRPATLVGFSDREGSPMAGRGDSR